MAALRMARHCDPSFPPALCAWVGSGYAVSRPAVLAQPGFAAQAARSAYPGSARRSGRPRYAFWPGVSFPSGVARCQQPRTCSGAAFIKFQVSAPAQITASNSGSSWLGPSKSAAVPVNTENAPPPAPDSRASRCSTVPRQIPHVEGAFDVHVDPRPRSGSQHPRSWPRPITVSRETMSPPSGPYRRRPADFIRLCVE
jgi:hypothetical protein